MTRGTQLAQIAAIVGLGGCAGNWNATVPNAPDARWTITSDGVVVAIRDNPFAISIRDQTGKEVLSTAAPGEGDGFATAAWTTGEVTYRPVLSPGYSKITEHLDPYREATFVEALEVSDDTIRLRLLDHAPFAEATPRTDTSDDPPTYMTLRVRPGAVRVSAWVDNTVPRAWSVGFRAAPDDGYLGLGERFNAVDQRGQHVFNWAEEGGIGMGEGTSMGEVNPWPNGALMTYYPVPFFVSTRGYGFWLDTTYYSRFDLQASRSDEWRVSHHGPTLDYEVYLPQANDQRPWPYQVTDQFTKATGRPMLPPAWAFGPRRRISRHSTQGEVLEIQAMRDADLAVTSADDALHFFPSARHVGREEQIAEWVSNARALGYHVNGYFNSFVASDAPAFAEFLPQARERGFFLRRPDGSAPNLWIFTGGKVVHSDLLDFTNPEAKSWYQSNFDHAIKLGYSGFMYDFGEYVPADTRAADGTSGEALHNQYPVQYARTLHEAMERSSKAGDWFAFMRSGYTGSSAYVPMLWAGDPAASFEDSDGLPSMVRAGLTANISGAPFWGGDIGGYHCLIDGAGAADEELLVRWIQQGALSPNMQDQNACVGERKRRKASIWNSARARAAWHKYARLHTRLFPYLYTWATRAHRHGEPMMRPLFFEHPNRSELRAVDDAYYLGAALLVAPILTRGGRERDVVLPDALYLDWDTKQLVAGGQRTLVAPLDKLPLLLRAGQLVPLLDDRIDTLTEESNPSVVGPTDVADVYDVVTLLSAAHPEATLQLHDGSTLTARVDLQRLRRATTGSGSGDQLDSSLTRVESAERLRGCTGCYWVDTSDPGKIRVLVSDRGSAKALGLEVLSTSTRRIRWDVSIALERAIVERAPEQRAVAAMTRFWRGGR